MGWVHTDIRFHKRLGLIEIPRGDSNWERFWQIADGSQVEPLLVVSVVRAIILQARPNLDGCVILGIQFNTATMTWRVLVSHESMPISLEGAQIECLPLVPTAKGML